MLNTDKWTCRHAALALAAFGVESVVTSPGSRNAPLLMAVSRHGGLMTLSVVDERSAAFIALGITEISQRPVALICTSGTALLNYAPAVCEAYHKHLPLIVISADRPEEWIDQADSQTMRQPDALSNFVKLSVDMKAEPADEEQKWLYTRRLNEALDCALAGCPGPVHINIRISEPLTAQAEYHNEQFHRISVVTPPEKVSTTTARALANDVRQKNILIVAGFGAPDAALNKAISTLGRLPNVVVLAESLSNQHSDDVLQVSDSLFSGISADKSAGFVPDLLISFGGAIVSAPLKRFLRQADIAEHWHVGTERNLIDTYRHLSTAIQISAPAFFPRFAGALNFLNKNCAGISQFKKNWIDIANRRSVVLWHKLQAAPWNVATAIGHVIEAAPISGMNLQLSNGLAVRVASMSCLDKFHRVDCNRGVSGIDGSTSTAVGASLAYKGGDTLLITGDMSFQYDLGALASNYLTSKLRIVLLNNGGGGIFKYIKTTRSLPEVDNLFRCHLNLDAKAIASAFGLQYHHADSYESLQDAVPAFFAGPAPAILEIATDAETDAAVLTETTTNN